MTERSSSTRRPEVRERLGVAVLDDGARDRAGEPLLAVVAQDPGQVVDVVGVEDVGGGEPLRLVHPHVERRVHAVGEAAVLLVQLQRRDAEVEEGGVDGLQPERLDHRGELVVHRVHQREPVRIRGEPLPREVEGLLVAVDPDDPCLRAALEDALGVAAHAERAVDADRPGLGESRLEQLHDPVAQDGPMSLRGFGFRHAGALWVGCGYASCWPCAGRAVVRCAVAGPGVWSPSAGGLSLPVARDGGSRPGTAAAGGRIAGPCGRCLVAWVQRGQPVRRAREPPPRTARRTPARWPRGSWPTPRCPRPRRGSRRR